MGSYFVLLAGILALLLAVPSVNQFVFSMEHPAYGLLNIFLYMGLAALLIGEGRMAEAAAQRLEKGEKKILLTRLLAAAGMVAVALAMGFSRPGGFLLSVAAASALLLRAMVTVLSRRWGAEKK